MITGGLRPGGRLPAACLAVATATYASILLVATHYPRPQVVIDRIMEQPAVRNVVRAPPSDTTMHLWAYAPLAMLAGATAVAGGWRSARSLVGLAAALALFAMLDQATQPLPWFRRTADIRDWISDCLGIAIGLAVVTWAANRRRALPQGEPEPRAPGNGAGR